LGKIYDKSGEHVIICAVREAHIRPFQATDWVDLRVGFFLSLCGSADPADDDTAAGLAESIGSAPSTQWTDRIAIGLTDSATGLTFFGYTNLAGDRIISPSTSDLVSSDVGITTANTFYWRPKSGRTPSGDNDTLRIIDSGLVRATADDGSQPHFIQSDPGAGEYCTFFGLRFTRPDATTRAKIITMQVKKTVGGHSSDILFTDDPSNAIGEAQLESFPTDVQTLGPVELSNAPDTFFLYWPFHNSRLRIHEICLVKVA